LGSRSNRKQTEKAVQSGQVENPPYMNSRKRKTPSKRKYPSSLSRQKEAVRRMTQAVGKDRRITLLQAEKPQREEEESIKRGGTKKKD